MSVLPGRAEGRALDGCRPVRAIFYAATGSLALAQALAADPSSCAQYFVSVPPLAADKTQMRSGVAGPIRALGADFHALAEVNVSAWQGWVAGTGGSWYQAGVEARRRMAATGFDVGAGDSWAVNEFSSAVRVGSGSSRQDMRDFVHGLYDGDGGPAAKGVVFVVGIGQSTASLDTYKARLESWLQDAPFWGDMGSYVSDFLQENYGDARAYGVAGADVPTRLAYLNGFLEHELQLAAVAPSSGAAAAAYLGSSYASLANAAWAWSTGFGYTAIPYEQMQDYVSAQIDAMRSFDASIGWSADRVGFAWDPSNSLGLSSSDFSAQVAAIQSRLADAIALSADPDAPGAGACVAPWCTATVDGAAFTPAWSTFSSWTPTGAGFATTPVTAAAGSASGPITIQPTIGSVVAALPIDTVVHVSSSSPGGSFSTSPGGPWTPSLDVTIPAGATSASFYMLDTVTGTPTVTAAVGAVARTQVEVVTEPAAPLSLTGAGNTVTYAEGGAPVAVDPGLAVGDSASGSLVSATIAISSGLTAGDALAATSSAPGITGSYANGTLTLSGPASLAAYQAVLRSVTFSGTSAAGGQRTIIWSANDGTTTASAVTTVLYTAPPSAPAGATAVAGESQATVTFQAPASNGGTEITSYTVTSSPGGVTATGSNSPIVVAGLANGTTYTFTVAAANAAGTGPSSSPSNAVTPAGAVFGGGGGGGGGGSSSAAGGSAAPASPTPSPAPAAPVPAVIAVPTGARASSKPVAVTVSAFTKPVVLAGRPPRISLSLRVAGQATTLLVRLRNARGRTLATWHVRVRPGANHLMLRLPPKASRPGRDRLALAWPGGAVKAMPVTVRRTTLRGR